MFYEHLLLLPLILTVGDKTEPQLGPRIEEGSGDSTPEDWDEIQMASQMEKEDSTGPQYPSNYHVFLHFLQFAIELFLFVISLGSYPVESYESQHK